MNAPLTFATAIMVGLMFISGGKGWKVKAATLVGYGSLILSFVRTAWIAWLIAMLVTLLWGRSKQAFRVVSGLAFVGVCLAIISLSSGTGNALHDRLDSLVHVQSDESFQARADLYATNFSSYLQEPFGLGLGATPKVDSGILSALEAMGLTGTLLFLGGVMMIGLQMMRRSGDHTRVVTYKSLFVAILFEAMSANFFVNAHGAFLWLMAGLWAAATATVSTDLACYPPVLLAHRPKQQPELAGAIG